MSIDNSYIGMVMYDIPVNDKKARKNYEFFRKTLLKKGYYQIQESIYVCKFSYKSTVVAHQLKLKSIAPKDSNIRMLILTKNQFHSIFVISGTKTFIEEILNNEKTIIEL